MKRGIIMGEVKVKDEDKLKGFLIKPLKPPRIRHKKRITDKQRRKRRIRTRRSRKINRGK